MPSKLRICLILALSIPMSSAAAAQTPAPDAAQRMAEEATRRIRELQAEADRLAQQASGVLGELRKLEIEREVAAVSVRKADADLAQVTAAVEGAAKRVEMLEAQRVANTPGVHERLVEIYKRGRGGYVRMLLAADDLRAFGRMSRGVAAVAELDRVRIDEHRRTIRASRDALQELETRRAQAASARAEAAKARRALETAMAAQSRRLDAIDRERDLAARYAGELQGAVTALHRHATGLASDAPAALPLAPFRGTLEPPVPGRIVSRFGRSPADRFGTVITRNGIEIAATEGQAVRAVHDATVAFAAPFVGYGTLVILDHGDNAFTLYGHLQQTPLVEGARVAKGSTVGRAGHNPNGEAVVYFEVRIDGRPVNPVEWLRSR